MQLYKRLKATLTNGFGYDVLEWAAELPKFA